MKAIQKEIGDAEGKDELTEIEDKIKKTKLSKEAREGQRPCGAHRDFHRQNALRDHQRR
jgi:ATP-dependent Lon protease